MMKKRPLGMWGLACQHLISRNNDSYAYSDMEDEAYGMLASEIIIAAVKDYYNENFKQDAINFFKSDWFDALLYIVNPRMEFDGEEILDILASRRIAC